MQVIKKAIYPGSFGPFTNGHLDMVKKASALFDEVYVVIGINKNKKRAFSSEGMMIAIEKTIQFENITNVKVCVHDGLTADFAKEKGI